MIPLPTTGVPGAEIFQASPAQATDWREELLRVDHNFNDKIRGMFRFAHDSWSTTNAFPLWTNGGSFPTIQTAEQGEPGGKHGGATTTAIRFPNVAE